MPASSHPHLQPCIPYLLAFEAAVASPTVLFTEWPVGPVGTREAVCHLSLDSWVGSSIRRGSRFSLCKQCKPEMATSLFLTPKIKGKSFLCPFSYWGPWQLVLLVISEALASHPGISGAWRWGEDRWKWFISFSSQWGHERDPWYPRKL